VMHAAGIVDHGYCHNFSLERLDRTLRPKVFGAWLLHRLFKETPLDFLVFFSSISSVISSPGLAAYAAANAFLDALAHYRRAQGLHCVSINWGPWAEVGMAARELADKGVLALSAINNIPIEEGLDLLGDIMSGDETQLAVCPVDWQSFAHYHQSIFRSPFFTYFHKDNGESVGGKAAKLRESLRAADHALRQDIIRTYICEQVSRVLRMPVERIDLNTPLNMMGLDSLITIELKDRIETDLDIAFSMVNLLRGPTVNQLTDQLLEQIEVSALRATPAIDMLVEDVDRLSDQDVDRLLAGLLAEEAGE
jgi:acyl carrier protein